MDMKNEHNEHGQTLYLRNNDADRHTKPRIQPQLQAAPLQLAPRFLLILKMHLLMTMLKTLRSTYYFMPTYYNICYNLCLTTIHSMYLHYKNTTVIPFIFI